MREQDLRFRREKQSTIEHTPVQRLLAKSITRQEQAAPAIVPQREREHAVNVFDHIAAVFFVKVREHFSVRSAAKSMPARFEVRAQLAIVVNLTVENYRDAVVLVEDGLFAG